MGVAPLKAPTRVKAGVTAHADRFGLDSEVSGRRRGAGEREGAYIDGELCGVDAAGLPSFARTQAATDGERGVHLVYYAFDLLHVGGWDISNLRASQAQGAARAARRKQTGPSVQRSRHRRRRAHPEARRQARLRRRGFEDDRRALCAWQPRALAQGQSAQPPRVRRRRLVRSGGLAAASRGAAARLLHR